MVQDPMKFCNICLCLQPKILINSKSFLQRYLLSSLVLCFMLNLLLLHVLLTFNVFRYCSSFLGKESKAIVTASNSISLQCCVLLVSDSFS